MRSRPARALRYLMVLLVVLGLAAACTSGDPAGPARPTAGPATGTFAAPSGVLDPSAGTGGTLRMVAGTVDSLDPARSYLPWVWNLMRLYTRTLVTWSPDGRTVVPDLATDTGKVSADGRTWTFTLRSGLRFDDGTPITSQAVKYGVERSFAVDVLPGGPTYLINLLDKPDAPYQGPYKDTTPEKLALASVATPDARTITFTLNRPYADFRQVLALPSAGPVPRARDTAGDYEDAPASSGPYRVTDVDPVTGIVLQRNPRWSTATDPVRTARPDRIVVRTGLTQLARDQAVLSGAADLDLTSAGVTSRTVTRIDASAALTARAVVVPTGRVRMLAVPVGVAPFTDPGCRQAVAALVSRSSVVQALGGADYAVPLADLWPTSMPGYEAGFTEPPPRDPATFAGCFPSGAAVNLAVPNVPADLQVGDALAAAFAKAGLTVRVTGADPATYYGGTAGNPATVKKEKLGLVSVVWSADYPGMSSFLARLVDSRAATNGGSNFAGLNDKDVVTALDKALAAPAAQSVAAWRTVAQLASGSYAYIPLVEERAVLLAGPSLTGARVSTAYHGIDVATVGVAAG